MKKLITYTTLCLIAILVLPSCKGRTGIMKRHYTKGYYVSHTKAKNKTLVAVAEPKQVEADKLAPINVWNTSVKESTIKEQENTQKNKSIMASASPNKVSTIYPKENVSYKSITIVQHVKELKKTVLNPGNAGDGDGLSLFWIIILVILILWLFGFLAGGFGLGGLINLLLVVALILLILWLLRIV